MAIIAHYGNRRYVLQDDVDLVELHDRISEALNAGGGMVALAVKGGAASILVSANLPLALDGFTDGDLQVSEV